ncbi:MAG TPA: bacterial transcriptional activator domain-containing protein [Roseiflexaceae bacterium]|nr:bacterial transcriptional activator domain-containing protein [Roseiflexaceae bacterium]
MYSSGPNPAALFLALLTNPQASVRQQASLIYTSMFGPRSLTYLRRLLESPDANVRDQATRALRAVAEVSRRDPIKHGFPTVSIECLGRVRLYVGAEEIRISEQVRLLNSASGWQKVESCLAYLMHCGRRGATISSIGAAVWGGRFVEMNVKRTLDTLQRIVANGCGHDAAARLFQHTDDHWALATDEVFSDVAAFEEAINRAYQLEQRHGRDAAVAVYAQACQLYGGPYMAGLLNDAPWARTRRAQLRADYLLAAEALMEYTFGCERYRDCIAMGTEIFDGDESADGVVCWLVRAHHQLGEWGQANYVYRRYLAANRTDARRALDDGDAVAVVFAELSALRQIA